MIAVPTSVGYGAAFHGLAALLAMLNACASGVGVVNIDNGFGAAHLACLILRRGSGPRARPPAPGRVPRSRRFRLRTREVVCNRTRGAAGPRRESARP